MPEVPALVSGASAARHADLTIRAISTTILDIPLIRPHRFAVASMDTQSVLLVRVLVEDGIEGLGEGVVPGGPWWGGESIDGMRHLVDTYLAPLLIGENGWDVERLGQLLDRVVGGAPFAKAAVEMALWDVVGKASGLPVHALLGGLHRSSLPVTWALGAGPASAAIDEAEVRIGHHTTSAFKLKMGVAEPADDVARVREIARALGGRATVAVDLNGAWDERICRRWLPELEAAGIDLIEQPVPRWNVAALASLRAVTRVPIMADESAWTAQDVARIAVMQAADVIALKVGKSGGIGNVRRMAAVAEAFGMANYGGTTIETSLGTAASCHLFCSVADLSAGSELFGPQLLADDITTEPVRYVDGRLQLPRGAGIGVTLDEEKVSYYARP